MKEEVVKNLNSILIELECNGSNREAINKLKKKIIPILEKNKSLDIIIRNIIDKIVIETKKFYKLKSKDNINYMTGFSSSIYLPSFDSKEFKLILTGGVGSRLNNNLKINKDTLFDVASITKLFTLILILKLSEEKIINLNDKIVDINPDFKGLEDYTFNDLIRMHGVLYTEGNVKEAKNSEEAYNILKTLYLKDNTRKRNKYNDYGAIIIGKTIEKVVSEKRGKKLSLADIMKEYIFDKCDMLNTTYNPMGTNISGNGGYDKLVHDPMTRLLNGITGSAGIFTTSTDLNKLAYELFKVNNNQSNFISKDNLNKIGEITFPRSKQSSKGNLGVYVKCSKFYNTFTPSVFSKNSFAHQGWTGALAIFDPNNYIHFNFLPNTIIKTDDKYICHDKPIGFIDTLGNFEDKIVDYIMMIYIIKKYYKKYRNEDIEINEYINIVD